jgi:hypothetical protein
MDGTDRPIDRLAALAKSADAAFRAVRQRQAGRMQCRAGCSACCRARLSITHVEETFLRRGLAALPEGRRAELAARTREDGREMCPALDDDGRCGIYAFRPLICRTYGAPLRHRGAVEVVRPPLLYACDLNFTDVRLRSLPPRDVLDQTAFVEALDSIDRDHCARNGLDPSRRIPLAGILGRDAPADP